MVYSVVQKLNKLCQTQGLRAKFVCGMAQACLHINLLIYGAKDA